MLPRIGMLSIGTWGALRKWKLGDEHWENEHWVMSIGKMNMMSVMSIVLPLGVCELTRMAAMVPSPVHCLQDSSSYVPTFDAVCFYCNSVYWIICAFVISVFNCKAWKIGNSYILALTRTWSPSIRPHNMWLENASQRTTADRPGLCRLLVYH